MKYTQSAKVQTQGIGSTLENGIQRRNQGIAGRFHYNWKYRYFIDFNFGYTGSENFHKDYRFGFFPALSGAWNLAEEPFMENVKWMDMFKIRYSWGKTGNDDLRNSANNRVRFPYLYKMDFYIIVIRMVIWSMVKKLLWEGINLQILVMIDIMAV